MSEAVIREKWNHTAVTCATMVNLWSKKKIKPEKLHPMLRKKSKQRRVQQDPSEAQANWTNFVMNFCQPAKKRKSKGKPHGRR